MQDNHGIDPDCYTCLVNQARATARHASLNREQTQEVLDTALRWIQIARYNPLQVQHVVRRVADTAQSLLKSKNQDLYADAKAQSHQIALHWAQSFREQLFKDPDPLAFGIQLAAAGNIIDFGAKEHGSFDLQQELRSVCHLEFGWDDREAFRERLSQARVLLYICDNVGEIDFDRVLMEYLRQAYPQLQIFAAMRQCPIINDATVDDALEAGLQDYATVISSGSVYPGTILAECTAEFKNLYAHADLIISKGQGNFETLLEHGDSRVFFLLRIKCDTMARLSGQVKGRLVFMQGKGAV